MREVTLKVNNTNWLGWKEVRINRSILQLANGFSLGLTDKWSVNDERRPINEGDACAVLIDGQQVIKGYIDVAEHSYDEKNHAIKVNGRDATADLVDCSAPSFQWAGRSLEQGAKALCEPFGIPVTANADISKAFARLKNDEGETVFDTLDAAARIRGVLMYADGQGGLVIGRASGNKLSGRLVLGLNIKVGTQRASLAERFSEYTVKGQPQAEGWLSNDTGAPAATVKDAAVSRYRPKTIIAEEAVDIASAKQRATWHRNVTAAKAKAITYTVTDWYLDDQLIEPGYLVSVYDDYLRIDRELLIVSVDYVIDDNGLSAELTLMMPEALDLLPLPEPEDEGGVW